MSCEMSRQINVAPYTQQDAASTAISAPRSGGPLQEAVHEVEPLSPTAVDSWGDPTTGILGARSASSSVSQPAGTPHHVASQHKLRPGASFASNLTAVGEGAATPVSGRRQKRTSKQTLEDKLPAFMRVNVPDAPTQQTPTTLPKDKNHGMVSSSAVVAGAEASTLGDAEATANGKAGEPGKWFSPTAHHEWHVRRKLEKRLALKNMVVIFCSEFVGTLLFLFFALAINTTCSIVKMQEKAASEGMATPTNLQALLVSSLGFGFSLAISAWVFFRVSGGVQNPAITLALTLTGALTWPKFVVLTVAQYAAGLAAAALVSGLYPFTVDSRTTLADGVTVNQGFWLEFFMSAQLIFTVLMLAAEKHKGTYLAPVGIGLALFITQLLGQPYTGASVNPARTLGPDVIQRTFDGYCWIYYAASYAAALVTSFFFLALKWIRYETATPNQDADVTGVHHQLILDMEGNVIAKMDTVPADEFETPVELTEEKELRQVVTDIEKGVQQAANGDVTPAKPAVLDATHRPSNDSSPQTTPVVGSNGNVLHSPVAVRPPSVSQLSASRGGQPVSVSDVLAMSIDHAAHTPVTSRSPHGSNAQLRRPSIASAGAAASAL